MHPEEEQTQERKKPGPKKKPEIDVKAILERVNTLEAVLSELATHTGYRAVLRKHGLEAYQPTKQDMSRFA